MQVKNLHVANHIRMIAESLIPGKPYTLNSIPNAEHVVDSLIGIVYNDMEVYHHIKADSKKFLQRLQDEDSIEYQLLELKELVPNEDERLDLIRRVRGVIHDGLVNHFGYDKE